MSMPRESEARAAFKAAEEREAFWLRHHQRFLELYPEQFVAALGDEVVAADKDLVKLIETIEASGYTLDDVKVDYITARPRYIL